MGLVIPETPCPTQTLDGAIYRVHAAYEELDKTEGRGGTRFHGYFHSELDAQAKVKGLGVMGSDGSTREAFIYSEDGGKTGVEICMGKEKIRIIPPGQKERIARALSKLTDEDKEILGLK